jgi:hypothetical protein
MTERRRVRIDGKAPPRSQTAPVVPEPADCACPRLDPEEWHDVENDWSDITFVRAATKAVLGVPVGYDVSRANLSKEAAKMGATVPEDAMLLIGEGRLRRQMLLEIEDAPDKAKGLERPGGIAFTRLVEAPWGKMREVVDEVRDAARERYGRDPDNMWQWWLTCRQCNAERNFETLVIAHYRNPA